MSDIQTILSTIKAAVDKLTNTAAAKQDPVYKLVINQLNKLDTKNGAILNNIDNLKLINTIKNNVEKLIIDPKYKDALKQFVQSYNDIADVQNQYFAQFAAAYTSEQAAGILKKSAIESTLNNLTDAGIQAGVTDGLGSILMRNMQAGGSIADLSNQLRNYLLTNETGTGALEQYVNTYATTAINQYSAEYNFQIANDLGLEWYMYDGSLLTTSREFCVKAVHKKYIHASEFETILHGDFGNLGKIPVNKKTGLPNGLMEGTNPENFPRRRGGWNCGHQLIAVADIVVPQNVKDAVYATAAYQNWALRNGKQPNQPSIIASSLQTNFINTQQNNIKKLFSKDVQNEAEDQTGLDYISIVNLTGGIPGAHISNIRHELLPQSNYVSSRIETDQYNISRYIYDDKHIYNAYMRVKDPGKGTGLNLFANQVIEARKQGFDYLEVSAEGNYRTVDEWNGYITWAKFGYSMDNYSKQRFQNLMLASGRKELAWNI
jgi:hypothetical protein